MADKKSDFNTMSGELDEVLARLQDADVNIDEAMKLYAKGQKLIRELEDYLKSAENTVKKIKVRAGKK